MKRILAFLFLFSLVGCAERVTLNQARLAYASSVAADVVTTEVAHGQGYTERNPLLSSSNPARDAGLLALIVPAIAESFNLFGLPDYAKAIYVGGTFVRFSASSWNLAQMLFSEPSNQNPTEVKK